MFTGEFAIVCHSFYFLCRNDNTPLLYLGEHITDTVLVQITNITYLFIPWKDHTNRNVVSDKVLFFPNEHNGQ